MCRVYGHLFVQATSERKKDRVAPRDRQEEAPLKDLDKKDCFMIRVSPRPKAIEMARMVAVPTFRRVCQAQSELRGSV